MPIPIFGWIAAGAMIAVGAIVVVGDTVLADNAEATRVAAQGANDQLDNIKRNVEAAQRNVDRIQKQMKEIENGLNSIGHEENAIEVGFHISFRFNHRSNRETWSLQSPSRERCTT